MHPENLKLSTNYFTKLGRKNTKESVLNDNII